VRSAANSIGRCAWARMAFGDPPGPTLAGGEFLCSGGAVKVSWQAYAPLSKKMPQNR